MTKNSNSNINSPSQKPLAFFKSPIALNNLNSETPKDKFKKLSSSDL
jgi:hypothetical protein